MSASTANMTRDEYVTFWGASRLRRWSPAVASTLALPPSSRAFLVEWGLPLGDGVVFSFDARFDGLAAVSQSPALRQFGVHAFAPLCIDERKDGAVIEVKGSAELLWNSTIERFGLCLVEFTLSERDALVPPPKGFKGRFRELADRTESQMRKIDPKAFVSPSLPWPSHCESLRNAEYPDPLELAEDEEGFPDPLDMDDDE